MADYVWLIVAGPMAKLLDVAVNEDGAIVKPEEESTEADPRVSPQLPVDLDEDLSISFAELSFSHHPETPTRSLTVPVHDSPVAHMNIPESSNVPRVDDNAVPDLCFDYSLNAVAVTLSDIESDLSSIRSLASDCDDNDLLCGADDNGSIQSLLFESAIQDTDLEDILCELASHSLLLDQTGTDGTENVQHNLMGFTCTTSPPILTRHPPPAMGRDDDLQKLKEILDDIYLRSGQDKNSKHRIMLAPDNKISKNLLKLIKQNKKYESFLVEFPVLHLRKSKITTLGSSYDNAGIKSIIKYMKDDDVHTEWSKLVTIEEINKATRMIRRLAHALHLGFLVQFVRHLPPETAKELRDDLQHQSIPPSVMDAKWGAKFEEFMTMGSSQNGTFALHREMMEHCDEVVGLHFAERISGQPGYDLLLSIVKQSLPFAFLNGSSQYATFCIELLYQHGRSGYFHQRQKASLFSVSHKGSKTNFALDAIREMDHRDAIKGFRPRAELSAIIPRMSLVDTFNEIDLFQKASNVCEGEESFMSQPNEDLPSWVYSPADYQHIIRGVSLMLRCKALDITPDTKIRNVYVAGEMTQELPSTILDANTYDIGKYLAMKFICKEGMFGLTLKNLPEMGTVEGPKELKRKVFTGKSTTVKRIASADVSKMRSTVKELREMKRKQIVKRQQVTIDCMNSDMNTCQALVKPDGSKPTIHKSKTMKTAISKLFAQVTAATFEPETVIYTSFQDIPISQRLPIKIVVVEFAGVKFKLKETVKTGLQYLHHVETSVIRKLLRDVSSTQRMIIREEKYHFTPDDLKLATRAGRKKQDTSSIGHLKQMEEIVSDNTIDCSAIKSTSVGKISIGNYLAQHAGSIKMDHDLILDIDSELIMHPCECEARSMARCVCPELKKSFCTPMRYMFHTDGKTEKHKLESIIQRKGEAEMSQVDWLIQCLPDLKPGDAVLSFVTSGDIDALPLHLFALSHLWPRDATGKFSIPVYVHLQNPGAVYNITRMIELLEFYFQEKYFAMKIALALCAGGNDFIPKYHGYSHDAVLKAFLASTDLQQSLFRLDFNADGRCKSGMVDVGRYGELVKGMYLPKSLASMTQSLTFDEVRQLTVKPSPSSKVKDPRMWLPPKTAVCNVGCLLNAQLQYLLTAGVASAPMPRFLDFTCFQLDSDGHVEYYFGPDVQVSDINDILTIDQQELNAKISGIKHSTRGKRTQCNTPQKGLRRKRAHVSASTPRKSLSQQFKWDRSASVHNAIVNFECYNDEYLMHQSFMLIPAWEQKSYVDLYFMLAITYAQNKWLKYALPKMQLNPRESWTTQLKYTTEWFQARKNNITLSDTPTLGIYIYIYSCWKKSKLKSYIRPWFHG